MFSTHRFIAFHAAVRTSALLSLAIVLVPSAFAQTPTLDILHTFSVSDGSHPGNSLIQAADGLFYGTTGQGGSGSGGTVYSIGADGAFNTLYDFGTYPSNATGQLPEDSLVEGMDSLLYGTTALGGTVGYGSVFSIDPTTSDLVTIYSFSQPNNNYFNNDGASPAAGLIQARDGLFYGTARSAGTSDDGTAFSVAPDGTFTALIEFHRNTNGSAPSAPMLQATDGNFYITTYSGGPGEDGSIVQLTPGGVVTDLHNFYNGDGEGLSSSLIEGDDHNFYGTATYGGASGFGVVYQMTPSGTVNDIYNFPAFSAIGCTLLIGTDGNFYGTTGEGGTNNLGTIFEMTPQGAITTLYSFSGGDDSSSPSSLIQASDGNLYGAAGGSTSGNAQDGIVFRLNINLPPAVQFNQSIYSANEKSGVVQIRVNRIGGTGPITVDYRTDDESAIAGTDYQTATGTLSWAAGDQTPKYIPIQVLNRDSTDGSLHTLALALLNPSGGPVLGHPFTATLTIKDGIPGAPVITSPATASGTAGQAFSYQVTASGQPTSYGAQGLPAGLTVNSATGLISGTPNSGGTFTVTLNAFNSAGEGSATLTLTVASLAPVITSPTTATATNGAAFSYQIEATNSPTSYNVTGKPPGLSIDTSTGLLSGTPTVSGTKTLTLSATNASGTGAQTLTLTIAPPTPAITSALTATATEGKAFTYQIKASNSPTTYGATGLPAGYSVNTSTGVISGTASANGMRSLTLKATNATGTGTATLTLTINPPAPVITSTATATATEGKTFSYQIKATNKPTNYNCTGKPPGLSIDTTTGLLSGTPTVSGTKTLTLSANNVSGTGMETLTLTIGK